MPLVEGFASMGLTLEQIADRLDVATSTLKKWMAEVPEFSDAVKKGREMQDEVIEGALYQRAHGYSHKAVKIFLSKEGEPITVEYMEHYPPDTGAAIFLLKNKKPDKYRDRREYILPNSNPLNVVFQREGDLDQNNMETNADKVETNGE